MHSGSKGKTGVKVPESLGRGVNVCMGLWQSCSRTQVASWSGEKGVKEPESLGKGVTCLYMVCGRVVHTLR
jgi:hypothetical protein